jgi:hypothetical protein
MREREIEGGGWKILTWSAGISHISASLAIDCRMAWTALELWTATVSKAETSQFRCVSSEISFCACDSIPGSTFVVYHDERRRKSGGVSPQISQRSTSQ